MKAFKPLMFAVLAGLPLAVVPAMAASDSAGATGTTSATTTPTESTMAPAVSSQPAMTYGQSSTSAQGTPAQKTPLSAPAKGSATGSEGSGGGK